MEQSKKTLFSFTILSMLILFSGPLLATEKNQSSKSALFSESEPIEIVLQMDMKKVFDDKSDDPEYTPALLIQKIGDNKIRTFNIKIKARGRTRRLEDICEFPPLKINFEKKSTENTVFEGQDKIKMVTHCKESDSYQNYTNLEYLVYKTYNLITDYSYQVRLVQVTYQDTKQNYPDIEKTGFFIEDENQMADRIGGFVTDKKIWSSDSCNQQVVDIFSLFQFMIGNTDWWIHTRHNVDLVQTENNGLIPIPFDFDYSGIINTPYAVPSTQLPIFGVKTRFLKNTCHDESHYDNIVTLYNQKKPEILSMIEQTKYLDKRYIRTSVNYIEQFYKIINNPEQFDKYLIQTCDFINNPPDRASK